MKIIPFKNLPSFTIEITLDVIPYVIQFSWNSRGSFWSMSIFDREQTPLILGIKLVTGLELISRYPDRDLPPGQLYVADPSFNLNVIQQDDFFNETLSLVYLEEDEVESI